MTDRPANDIFRIVHATDLLPDGQTTFNHAVAVARDTNARLTTLHVTSEDVDGDNPDAYEILARISEDEPGLVHDVLVEGNEKKPERALLEKIRELAPDLLIVGTRQQTSDKKKVGRSLSETVTTDTEIPTLVVHIGQEGIVDANGQLHLRRILLPVGDGAEARDTIQGLTKFLDRLGIDEVDIYLLRVGDKEVLDYLTLPERDGWRWHREVRKRGFVANVVADVCEEKDIDLIAMATRGKDGFIDAFSGTHTEKVIRRAPRPVLAVVATDVVKS